MDENLFGDPYDTPQKKTPTLDEKQKRRWEDGFQKWSNEQSMSGLTHYGRCGYGAICDFCKDNSYGRPCVRALNEMLRTKRMKLNYNTASYYSAFDGEV